MIARKKTAVQTRSAFFYQCAWYVCVDRQRTKLCDGTAEERALWKKGKRMRDGVFPLRDEVQQALLDFETFKHVKEGADDPQVWTLAELYLAHQEDAVAYETFQPLKSRVVEFASSKNFGNRTVSSIRISEVEAWVKARKRKRVNSRRSALKAVKALFNWCVDNNYLAESPIKSLKTPKAEKRRRIVSNADFTLIQEKANRGLARFCTALFNTGRRPNEIARLKRADVRYDEHEEPIAFETIHHKNYQKTGLPEYIPLNATMRKLVAESLADPKNTTEYVFVTTHGRRWRVKNWVPQFERLRLKHGMALTAYWFRHEFITRSLVAGVPVPLVAQISGNSIATIQAHYDQTPELAKKHFAAAIEQGTASIPVVA
jgi:integrase